MNAGSLPGATSAQNAETTPSNHPIVTLMSGDGKRTLVMIDGSVPMVFASHKSAMPNIAPMRNEPRGDLTYCDGSTPGWLCADICMEFFLECEGNRLHQAVDFLAFECPVWRGEREVHCDRLLAVHHALAFVRIEPLDRRDERVCPRDLTSDIIIFCAAIDDDREVAQCWRERRNRLVAL